MSVNVIDTIKPKNGGTFPVVEAVDVAVTGSQRLPAALDAKANTADLNNLSNTLSNAIATKADKIDLSGIRTEIALKAPQSSLDALGVVVASKAAQSSLDALSVVVDHKADKTSYDGIYAALDKKADISDLNNLENAYKQADTDLQNQIDQIEISASAEAVVAPEVTAARVGADGESYSTLKERIDSENVDIKNSFSQNVVEVISEAERNYTDATIENLTFDWLDYKTVHITGNGNNALQTYTIYIDNTQLPKNIEAGKKYVLNIKGAVKCTADIFTVAVSGDNTWREAYKKVKEQTVITIPDDAVGLLFRVGAWNVTGEIDETIEITIVEATEGLIPVIMNRNISVSKSTNPVQSLDDVNESCVIFIESNSGVPSVPDSPTVPAYVMTICYNNNIKLQVCYPYNNTDKIKYRNNRAGTWSAWTSLADENDTSKAVTSLGVLAYNDANNIDTNCFIFVGSSAGQPSMINTPVFPCWIETIGVGTTVDSIISQVCYPYNDNTTLYRRVKKQGTWTSWTAIVGGGTETIEQEISRDTYNNTYNITTSPTITTSTNGWLQAVDTDTADESNKTDMTGAIMSMLNDTGYCHLSEGIFYVSGSIDLPSGSTLEGCGNKTIIRLLQSVESGYICRVKEYSTIKNIRFSGGYNQLDISTSNIGGRKGIIAIGNRDGQTPSVTPTVIKCCQISNCWFENLDSGIYGYNSGGGLEQGLIVSDCYITRCKAGINLDYWVEYCKFSNIVTFQCYYACINNGGNNVFTGCTFHGVIGMQIDDSAGTKTNNAHGSVIGCTFNHIDNMNHPETLGNGYAIKVIDADNGFVFSGCQIWYGKVYVESSKGVQISDTLFGGAPVLETVGSDTVFLNGCIFGAALTKSTGSPVIFNNCYKFDGTPVT